MELSLPAWLGALCGMIVAAAIYVPGIRLVERRLHKSSSANTPEQRVAFEDKLVGCAAPDFGFRCRHSSGGRLLDRQHAWRCARLT